MLARAFGEVRTRAVFSKMDQLLNMFTTVDGFLDDRSPYDLSDVISDKILPILEQITQDTVLFGLLSDVQKERLLAIRNALMFTISGDAARHTASAQTEEQLVAQPLDQYDEEQKKAIMQTIVNDKSSLPKIDGFYGQNEAKAALVEAVLDPILYPEWFANSAITPFKTVLLYGPPGNGKTRLGKTLAGVVDLTSYYISMTDWISTWSGESGYLLRGVFDFAFANGGPCMIFIDDFDSLYRMRQTNDNDFIRRFKTEFFSQLERLHQTPNKIVLICATDFPWELDISFLKRFEKQFFIGLPDGESRKLLLRECLRRFPFTADVSWFQLIEMTDGYTCNDIKRFALGISWIHFKKYKEFRAKYPNAPIRNLFSSVAVNAAEILELFSSFIPSVHSSFILQYAIFDCQRR